MPLLTFDLDLYKDFQKNPTNFVGSVIDISTAPDIFSGCFNTELAASYGVTSEELSNQALELNLHKIAHNAGLKFVSLFKEHVVSDSALLDSLREDRILVLK
jgi:hypothetical protein